MVTEITIIHNKQVHTLRINLKYRWVVPFTIEDKMTLERLVGRECRVAVLPDTPFVLYKTLDDMIKIIPCHALTEMGLSVADFQRMAYNAPIDIDVALAISRI